MRQRLLTLPSLVAFAFASQACGGYAMMQTGRTQPEGSVALVTGASIVKNRDRLATTDTVDSSTFPDIAARAGISNRVDLTMSTYGAGGGVTVKMNVLPLSSKFAVAPRLGLAGGGIDSGRVLAGLAGGMVSFDATRWVSLYAGATFFNHWITQPKPSWAVVRPGEQEAARKGYGDGLLQMGAGLSVGNLRGVAAMVEYNRLIPMQNDPGDYYKFQSANLIAFALGFCLGSDCKEPAASAQVNHWTDRRERRSSLRQQSEAW